MAMSSSDDALRDCSNTSMENSQQRKRPASPLNIGDAKRSRRNDDNAVDNNDAAAFDPQRQQDGNDAPQETTSNSESVESLLAVPLNVIFRQVPGTQKRSKPLLTRAEAQCLVKIAQLAYQVDAIVDLSSRAFSRQEWCQTLSESIQGAPLLRSILPILSVHGTERTSHALQQFQGELDRILVELEACACALRQYSEQNWTLSESLLDAFGGDEATTITPGQDLATEKRFLAEIQEEVCARLERVLKMSAFQETLDNTEQQDAFEQATESGQFVSMAQFCNRLFGMEESQQVQNTEVQNATVPEEQQSQGSSSNTGASNVDKHGEAEVPARPQEEQTRADEQQQDSTSALLALTKEAAKDRGQWSQSTASIHAPEPQSSTNNDDKDDDEDSEEDEVDPFGEMTQRTSRAVAALTVLAAGGSREGMDQGDN